MNELDNGTKTVTKNIIHMRRYYNSIAKYMHGIRLPTLEQCYKKCSLKKQSVYHICISFVHHLKDKLNAKLLDFGIDGFNSHIFTITAIYDISGNKPLIVLHITKCHKYLYTADKIGGNLYVTKL